MVAAENRRNSPVSSCLWGAHAAVVRPKALADRVLTVATAMRRRYSKTTKPKEGQQQSDLGLRPAKGIVGLV